jgi:hypothetical protein
MWICEYLYPEYLIFVQWTITNELINVVFSQIERFNGNNVV